MKSGIERVVLDQARSLEGLQILLAEDQIEEAEILTLMLENAGAKITRVVYAYQVLEALKRFNPDVFICDIRLPDVNGDLLIQQIRSQTYSHHYLPAIAITAYIRDTSRERILEAGFDYFLPKTYDFDALVGAVLDVLGNAKS